MAKDFSILRFLRFRTAFSNTIPKCHSPGFCYYLLTGCLTGHIFGTDLDSVAKERPPAGILLPFYLPVMHQYIAPQFIETLKKELRELDKEMVQLNGTSIAPSQCYRLELDPAHVLFNTNCPADLKERIEGLLHKYYKTHEGGTH